MFGGPGQAPSEEEKKKHQEYTNQTVQTAFAIAAALWLVPSLIHFAKKRF